MIEFDRKLKPISTSLLIQQRSLSKKHWDIFLISLCVYFIVFVSVRILLNPLKTKDIFSLIHILFSPPFILDFVVTRFLCFFLQNIHVRFRTLNDFWKYLPVEMPAVFDQWTHIKIVFLMEKTRLLHSELNELLKKFSLGHGPLLLTFFSFSFSNFLIGIFFIVKVHPLSSEEHTALYGWNQIFTLIMNAQITIFMLSVIVYVSLIDDQRMKIISYLRLYRTSNLHMDVKLQIKMFMNQVSVFEFDQITAFGLFNINLNLVVSILIMVITGMITLVQMKYHPLIIKLNNDTNSFLTNVQKKFH